MDETTASETKIDAKTEGKTESKKEDANSKIKTRSGSGYLKQLYSTARTTAGTTHSHLKNLTTFLVNFIPVEKVDASELQVRTHFDDSEIQGLSNSIKEHGVLQPILVVQDGDRYKVIAGERRLRAAKLANMERIPARVLSTNDKATHEIALRENLDRVDLHPIEEGEGYQSLLEAGAYGSYEQIAQAFGKLKSRITECIGFTKLPELTKQELMRRSIRNRALLRTLLSTPPEEHLPMIEKIAGKDEVYADAAKAARELAAGSNPSAKGDDSALPKPKEMKPFVYRIDKKGVVIPAFKWKPGEGPARLEAFRESLKKLMTDVESCLARK
jgi:ParB family chromosome partitioning protein